MPTNWTERLVNTTQQCAKLILASAPPKTSVANPHCVFLRLPSPKEVSPAYLMCFCCLGCPHEGAAGLFDTVLPGDRK